MEEIIWSGTTTNKQEDTHPANQNGTKCKMDKVEVFNIQLDSKGKVVKIIDSSLWLFLIRDK
jgi:hypothetical protein